MRMRTLSVAACCFSILLARIGDVSSLAEETDVECFYPDSTGVDANLAVTINTKCRQADFQQYVSQFGKLGVFLDPRRCGIDSINSTNVFRDANICYSTLEEGIAKSIEHKFRLPLELYYDDFTKVTKKRFKKKRFDLEEELNDHFLRSPLRSSGFNRATVIALTSGGNGVDATILVQFGPDGSALTHQQYKDEWAQITENGTLSYFSVDIDHPDVVKDPDQCPEVSSLEQQVPADLWSASQPLSDPPQMGEVLKFQCPDGLHLSSDHDQLDRLDQKFSILCSSLLFYSTPTRWPTCVTACPIDMPAAPNDTGLLAVTPPLPISAGKSGRYACVDAQLGVEKGSTHIFSVECLDDGTYRLPEVWPRCLARTTTVSPVIPVAVREFIVDLDQRLEYRVQVTQLEEEYVPKEVVDWFTLMTIPASLGMCACILFICFCTRPDANCCYFCGDEGNQFKRMKSAA